MKRLLYPTLFIAFGLYLLMGGIPDFLLETASMTPFISTSDYAAETILNAGGLLAWCSQWLTSCFAFPWLGAVLLVGVLVALAYIVKRAFRIPAAWEGLCWLPSLAVLLNYSQQGYMLYVMKQAGTAFSMPLGFIVGVSLFALYLRIRPLWGRMVWIAVVATAFYYFIGAYAFLPLALALLNGAAGIGKSGKVAGTAVCAFTVLSALSVPWLLYMCGVAMCATNTFYTIGLPDYLWSEAEQTLWIPLLFAVAVILILSLPTTKQLNNQTTKQLTHILCLAAFLLCASYVYTHTFTDENYRCILKMKRAVEENKWEEVLEVARQCESAPTRLQVLYTRLALHEVGRGGSELFKYRDGDTPYNAPRMHQYLRLVGGRSLYYHYGKVNYSYRWCMEDFVEYGKRPDYLRYMLKCAIMNDEPLLAEKYLGTLKDVPFQSDFVSKYEPYIHNEELRKNDREMQSIDRLTNYANLLDGDGGLIEVYLLNSFALMEGGTREMVELSLQSCMILKDLQGFWQRFIKLLPTFKDGKIPFHYQEAALLVAAFNENLDISFLPIDADIRSKFDRLVEASNKNSHLGEEYNRNSLYPQYGGTYWYYYFFVKGLKTN